MKEEKSCCGHHHKEQDEHCGCGHHHEEHGEHCGCGHHHKEHGERCGCGHHHEEHSEPCDCHRENQEHTHPGNSRVFLLENLGCANCAAKMEEKIRGLPGVYTASITFATKQLRISADRPERCCPRSKRSVRALSPRWW